MCCLRVVSSAQLLCTVNTVIALCASCLTTFVASALLNKRLSTVDLQNATLAGGVCIGAASNLRLTPGIAFLVGACAAVVSCVGFNRLQSYLEDKIGLHDSCGVHNLHGLPAVLGSVVMAIAVSAGDDTRGDVVYPKGDAQWGAELAGAGITLVVALAAGAIVGGVLKRALPAREGMRAFRDAEWWVLEYDE